MRRNPFHQHLKMIAKCASCSNPESMGVRSRQIVPTLFAVLLLAVGSVASARMMAPDEDTIMRAEVAALGLYRISIAQDEASVLAVI
ncbi:hypothetical protein PSAL_018330 [Pseudooceanicola algae]|uniref:Uncharacterized protein n=2 Tax=Pseudooceanicola algae TaxID=1537215 RepID=A0A418SLH8_9RHOB|nr:hypothetical protein PSAL_018330 [Pseudooceanicola algae]